MDFRPTAEQGGFARSLTDLMAGADPVAVARAWAAGDRAPGLRLWRRLAAQGVNALLVPEEHGGMGGSAADLAVAFEVLGHQLAVGPWIEAAACLPHLLADEDLAALAEGTVATLALPPHVPAALDADVAELVYMVHGRLLHRASVGEVRRSVDVTRLLAHVRGSDEGAVVSSERLHAAFDTAVLACAAELLGCGERMLADTVDYAKQRKQYGRAIGSFQAVKHQLADVRIALDFVRPLVHGAAVSLGTPEGGVRAAPSAAVSAAKVAAADAAYLASRVALQVHGAIGYTAESDLSLWITRVRALVAAWGSSSWHRSRIAGCLELGPGAA